MVKIMWNKIVAALLVSSVVLVSGCVKNQDDNALVVGYSQFNGVFSPFFAVTDVDADVAAMTGVTLLKTDPSGALISNASEYIPPQEIQDGQGNVNTRYTFRLIDGLAFSDGTKVTADDVIFSLKVLCDPTYDGLLTVGTLPLLGIDEYQYDNENVQAVIDDLQKQAETVTDEELYACILENAQADYEKLGEEAVVEYVGFTNPDKLEGQAKKEAVIKAYADFEMENSPDYYIPIVQEDKFKKLKQEYVEKQFVSHESKVSDIEGIQKVDDKTVTVTIEGVSPVALWDLASVTVVPQSYYGKSADGKSYQKGDLSVVKAKNNAPIGAGPYTFTKYENNVVTFKANPHYFKGKPKIEYIKFQTANSVNKIESVANGEFDIAEPMATKEALEQAKEKALHYSLVGNLGYGYIGINANRITDKNVRKGLMHLMSREPAVDSYYGELATVIERPLSKTSWAYPQDAQAVYRFDTQKALEYFKLAGYVQTTQNGKTMLKKGGKQLKIQVGIGGEGIMDHPSAPILTQMKIELEKMGGVLDIVDCDMNLLVSNLDAGEWDMWAASWELTKDPDMYQKYHSEATSNYYGLADNELDELLVAARSTNDMETRKTDYKKCLDIVMDEAVEMPVYQRMNLYVYNKNTLDISTLPENITAFYDYFAEVEQLKLASK